MALFVYLVEKFVQEQFLYIIEINTGPGAMSLRQNQGVFLVDSKNVNNPLTHSAAATVTWHLVLKAHHSEQLDSSFEIHGLITFGCIPFYCLALLLLFR